MKKSYILLTSMILVIFFGIFIGIALLRSFQQTQVTERSLASFYATNAAESGISRILTELRSNMNWGREISQDEFIQPVGDLHTGCHGAICQNIPVTSPDGTILGFYDIISLGGVMPSDTDPPWQVIPFRVIGRNNDIHRTINIEIDVQMRVQNPAAFAFFTLGDIVIDRGTQIGTDQNPADLVCRDLKFSSTQEDPVIIYGDVRYLRNYNQDGNEHVYIYDGSIGKGDPVTFVGVDTDFYKGEAGNIIKEDYYISGNISRQELDSDNGLIYVDGDVYISGEVQKDEAIVIIASGDIYIEGDITYATSDGNEQIGLFSKKDIIISESAPDSIEINAMIVADGGVFRAEGNDVKDTLSFSGAISARGKGSGSAIDLNIYRNRNYVHDFKLVNNLMLPAVRFLADVRLWQNRNEPYIPVRTYKK